MKRIIVFLFICLLPVFFTGCAGKEPAEEPSVTPPIEENQVEVTLYYPNEEFIRTGNEKLDQLIPVKKVITVKENQTLPAAILEALKDQPDHPNLTTGVANLTFLNVDVKENTAYVNIAGKNLNGGSLQEALTIKQIVYSLTELNDIKKVQFLIDGEKKETLMGHIAISEPVGRHEYRQPAGSQENYTTTIKVFLIAIDDNGQSGKRIATGDSVVPIGRTISTPETPLTGALTELLRIKDRIYGQSGLYNPLYQSNLVVENVKIADGTATIHLTGNLMLGGVMDNPRVKAQITETARQFPSVNQVNVFLNGKTLDEALSLK